MKLIEAIRDLNTLNKEGTIYASLPWAENSEAIVASEPGAGGLFFEAAQLCLSYFLEVVIARDFVESWMATLDVQPTLQQKCTRVIEYAVTEHDDAWSRQPRHCEER